MESSKTKARVIYNPASGGGDYDPDEVKKELGGFDIERIPTEKPGDGAVNGLGKAGFPEGVTLGILSTGTGNDLAATFAIPEDPDGAEDAIRQNRVRTLDAARASSEGVGDEPIEFEVIPGALRVVVGRDYVAEPER